VQRLRITYAGRVQRVGFRATARDCASVAPVSGWVRNAHDGTVEMEIQGTSADIQTVLDLIRLRMGAKITRIDQFPIMLEPAETGFVIAH
jgi:acylphosphatase